MTLRFTINGAKYWIDEFADGFCWISKTDEGTPCKTQAEAQQQCLNYYLLQQEEAKDQPCNFYQGD